MKYSEQIKPISYLKAHASEIAEDAFRNNKTYIITQNGYAKLALIGIKEYEKNIRDLQKYTADTRESALKDKISKVDGLQDKKRSKIKK